MPLISARIDHTDIILLTRSSPTHAAPPVSVFVNYVYPCLEPNVSVGCGNKKAGSQPGITSWNVSVRNSDLSLSLKPPILPRSVYIVSYTAYDPRIAIYVRCELKYS